MNNQQFYKKLRLSIFLLDGSPSWIPTSLLQSEVFQKSNFHKSSVEFNNS
jgi:hypothetical protein